MNRLAVYSAVLVGTLMLAALAVLAVVDWRNGDETEINEMETSKEEAIEIARERVEAEGVVSLEGRDTVVEDRGSEWWVSFPFPFTDLNVRGGEDPTVVVSKADGSILNVVYTQ